MGALLRGLIAASKQPGGHRLTQISVGTALGIDQTYVGQLMKSDNPDSDPRGIGAELIRKTLEHFRIDPWYFFDFPTDKIPDWRLYIIPRGRAPTRGDDRRGAAG